VTHQLGWDISAGLGYICWAGIHLLGCDTSARLGYITRLGYMKRTDAKFARPFMSGKKKNGNTLAV
jgi:hypothetical protein